MKYCKCGKVRDRNGRYCKSCHNEYMREWRKTNKISEEQRKRSNCRSYSRVYMLRGKLIKENCEICGEEIVERHHDDYSKPLSVRWLCKNHHQEITNYNRCIV